MLILFDIDATLLTTGGAGIRAMGLAGRALHGPAFDERRVEFAGRLDPLIVADLLVGHGVEATPEAMDRFRAAYREHLEAMLREDGVSRACPGVPELLSVLGGVEGITLGLLTGNYPETGELKLRAGGIEPALFGVAVWGCDCEVEPASREHLPPVAMARYRARYGRAITGREVTIVGDTPHDVACGKAHGCRVLGVGTGMFPVESLVEAGADRVVASLEETAEIARWLTGEVAPAGG